MSQQSETAPHASQPRSSLVADAAAMLPELQALRRELHGRPELGLQLPWTQQRVLQALANLPLEISTGASTTSVTAVLRGGRPGRTVLLRGDMDGLPVDEATGLDYASTNGSMHACGHDLHIAGLVGAAKLLCARREEIAGSVVFMFQPGEEGHFGALRMIEEGVLDAAGELPIAAYGVHVWPGERGVFATRPGGFMASSNELSITVHGRGGHGSQPHTAADPVVALADIITQLQVMVTRRFNVFDPVVVTVTQLSAGDASNVIPASASLVGTVRTMSKEHLAAIPGEIEHLAVRLAEAHGCTAEVAFLRQYAPTINDPDETGFAVGRVRELLGDPAVVIEPHGLMGAEDFSFVLDRVPGVFFSLYASPDDVDPGTAAMNHSPGVLFDDSVLERSSAALAHLAITRLARAAAE